MALYLLDTNHVTYLLQRVGSVVTAYRGALQSGDEMALSPVVFYEILRGLRESIPNVSDRSRAEADLRQLVRGWRRLAIGIRAAEHASTLWVERRQRGQQRPDDGDALIVGQALAASAVLVTADAASASDARKLGVAVENWF